MAGLIDFIIFVSLALKSASVNCDPIENRPKVILPHGGALVGSFMKTVAGKPIRAFRGIPYAEPPIGNLRFSPPVPAKSWSGDRFANKDSNKCPMKTSERIFEYGGDEDCLYLNVYTPDMQHIHDTQKQQLPVMVYLHGGGWMVGSGLSSLVGPQRLLDHDVILVTSNYRLGALGFLSTGTTDCPGNNGMKDQVMMLKWVQENIESFGGNQNNVTLFGESAGGASVGFHMYSPLSKGLFHKAILQSGTNFINWAIGDKSVVLERTKKVGEIVSCPANETNWKAFIECLRSKPALEIASVVREHFKYDVEPAILYPVVVEPEADGAFITKHPNEVDEPPSNQVPIIIGVTSEEGAMRSGPLLNLRKDDFTAKFYDVIATLLYYDHKPKDIQDELTKKIDEFYFKNKHDWTMANHFNLTNLFSDNWFIWGTDKFLRNRLTGPGRTSAGPTYVYLFDHRGPKSFTEMFSAGPQYMGVCHMDEIPYLFIFMSTNIEGDSNDTKMKWAMPYMWINFAKTGNPTPENSELPVWKPADQFPINYAHIGRKTKEDWVLLSNEVGLFEDRMQFWRNVEHLYWENLPKS